MSTAIARKRVVAGSVGSRWPKARIVRWLELGAIPALVGLWLPDWSGALVARVEGGEPALALPPLVTFAGALVLLKACAEGVKGMGWHYRGVRASGAAAIALAVASLGAGLALPLAPRPLAAVLVGAATLGLLAGTAVLWFTIAKVAEITTERRTLLAQHGVAALALSAATAGLTATAGVLSASPSWPAWLRASLVLSTGAFLLCRYGVHCYRTQRSIGAAFAVSPAEQFWT